MTMGEIRITNGQVLATVEVEPAGDLLFGRLIHLEDTDDAALFTEYEHAVLAQLLVEVERLDARIAGLSPRFLSEHGVLGAIDDLQLYPLQRTISFTLRVPKTRTLADESSRLCRDSARDPASAQEE